MPLLSEALRFAQSPATSVEQLRLACELVSLKPRGRRTNFAPVWWRT